MARKSLPGDRKSLDYGGKVNRGFLTLYRGFCLHGSFPHMQGICAGIFM